MITSCGATGKPLLPLNALVSNQPPDYFVESLADLDHELERQAPRAASRLELAARTLPALRDGEVGSAEALLSSILQRRQEGPGSALSDLWLSYPEQVLLAEQLAAQDPQVIFSSLHPIGDEFWNMIDGHRTVMEIAEVVCSEFAFNFDPTLLLPLARGLVRIGLASVANSEKIATSAARVKANCTGKYPIERSEGQRQATSILTTSGIP